MNKAQAGTGQNALDKFHVMDKSHDHAVNDGNFDVTKGGTWGDSGTSGPVNPSPAGNKASMYSEDEIDNLNKKYGYGASILKPDGSGKV